MNEIQSNVDTHELLCKAIMVAVVTSWISGLSMKDQWIKFDEDSDYSLINILDLSFTIAQLQ